MPTESRPASGGGRNEGEMSASGASQSAQHRASCHPRRRTAPNLDGLCATCACAVRANVRRGQSPDEARVKQLIRVEAEQAALAENTEALLALAQDAERQQIVDALRGRAAHLDSVVEALPWPVRRDPYDDGADRADARAFRYVAALIEDGEA